MLWEYLGAWSSKTKLLLHLDWNANDSSWNWNNWAPTNVTWIGGLVWSWSASFNWTTSRIATPSITFNASSEFTFSCYLKISAWDTDYRAVIGFGNNYQLWSILFWKWNNNTPYVHIQDTSNNSISLNPNINITDWIYRNFIFTYKNKVWVLYINWVQVATQTNNSLTWNFYNTVDHQLWCKVYNSTWTYHQFLNWNIDEIIIKNRAWSADEVKKYYTYSQWKFIL